MSAYVYVFWHRCRRFRQHICFFDSAGLYYLTVVNGVDFRGLAIKEAVCAVNLVHERLIVVSKLAPICGHGRSQPKVTILSEKDLETGWQQSICISCMNELGSFVTYTRRSWVTALSSDGQALFARAFYGRYHQPHTQQHLPSPLQIFQDDTSHTITLKIHLIQESRDI